MTAQTLSSCNCHQQGFGIEVLEGFRAYGGAARVVAGAEVVGECYQGLSRDMAAKQDCETRRTKAREVMKTVWPLIRENTMTAFWRGYGWSG